MDYQLFKLLYQRAIESDNVNDFVKQAGLNLIDVDNVESLLTHIYNLAKNDFTENRKQLTSNRAEFARLYDIPKRTVQNWELGDREISPYLKRLIDYTIFMGNQYSKNKPI